MILTVNIILADQMLNDSLECSNTTNTTGLYVDPKVNVTCCFAYRVLDKT